MPSIRHSNFSRLAAAPSPDLKYGVPPPYHEVVFDEAGLIKRIILQDAAGLPLVDDVADVDPLVEVGEGTGRAQDAGLPQFQQVAEAFDEEVEKVAIGRPSAASVSAEGGRPSRAAPVTASITPAHARLAANAGASRRKIT